MEIEEKVEIISGKQTTGPHSQFPDERKQDHTANPPNSKSHRRPTATSSSEHLLEELCCRHKQPAARASSCGMTWLSRSYQQLTNNPTNSTPSPSRALPNKALSIGPSHPVPADGIPSSNRASRRNVFRPSPKIRSPREASDSCRPL
jgi:hypothetical protein